MAYILSIETSTNVCSAAIHHNGIEVASLETHIDQSHASKLAPMIEEVITKSGIQPNQVQAVAITSGPGSYTGLRIGTSTAKGFCFAHNIPLITVPTLELLAFQISTTAPTDYLLCPMLDARRMEVYYTLTTQTLHTLHPTQPKIIDTTSFQQELDQHHILFFGNGASKCQTIITHPHAHFIPAIYPSASQLGIRAFQYFQQNKTADLLNFEPHYLKEFMAKTAKNPLQKVTT